MHIRIQPIPQVHKPKELVILIKTPQDELFVRHFMHKVLDVSGVFDEAEVEFAIQLLDIVKEEPKGE